MTFKSSLLIAALTALMGFSASAKELNGNVIIRYNKTTGTVERMMTTQKIHSAKEAEALVRDGKFESIEGHLAVTELDREAGASSWFWFCPSWGWSTWAVTPQFYWYGTTFSPWFNSSFNNFNYYYYGSSGFNNCCGNGWW